MHGNSGLVITQAQHGQCFFSFFLAAVVKNRIKSQERNEWASARAEAQLQVANYFIFFFFSIFLHKTLASHRHHTTNRNTHTRIYIANQSTLKHHLWLWLIGLLFSHLPSLDLWFNRRQHFSSMFSINTLIHCMFIGSRSVHSATVHLFAISNLQFTVFCLSCIFLMLFLFCINFWTTHNEKWCRKKEKKNWNIDKESKFNMHMIV